VLGHGDILSHLVTMLDFIIYYISVNLVISVYFVFLSVLSSVQMYVHLEEH